MAWHCVWLRESQRVDRAVRIDVDTGKRDAAVADVDPAMRLAGVAFKLSSRRYLAVYIDPTDGSRVVQRGRSRLTICPAPTVRHRTFLGVVSRLAVRASSGERLAVVARSQQACGFFLDPVTYDELDKEGDDPLYDAAGLIGSLQGPRGEPAVAPPQDAVPDPRVLAMADAEGQRRRADDAWAAVAPLRSSEPGSRSSSRRPSRWG